MSDRSHGGMADSSEVKSGGMAQRRSLSTPKTAICPNRLELLQCPQPALLPCSWQVDAAAAAEASSPPLTRLPSLSAGRALPSAQAVLQMSSLWLINGALVLFSESEIDRAWSLLTSACCSDFHCELSGDSPGNSVESVPSPASSLTDRVLDASSAWNLPRRLQFSETL